MLLYDEGRDALPAAPAAQSTGLRCPVEVTVSPIRGDAHRVRRGGARRHFAATKGQRPRKGMLSLTASLTRQYRAGSNARFPVVVDRDRRARWGAHLHPVLDAAEVI